LVVKGSRNRLGYRVETGPWLVEHLADAKVLAKIGEELEHRQHVFVVVLQSI
jgi:hypothetical protein